jgi:tetratricopeptide (TPR) repeat protein
MYTLLISAGAGLAGFALGAVAVNVWAGFIPGLLAFVLIFLLLSRRTMAQVQAIFATAQGQLQKAPPPAIMHNLQEAQRQAQNPPPELMRKLQEAQRNGDQRGFNRARDGLMEFQATKQREFDQAREAMIAYQRSQREEVRNILRSALIHEKWQYLVRENVYTQLGTIDYQEGVEAVMMRQQEAAARSVNVGTLPDTAGPYFEQARDNLQKAWHPQLSSVLKDWRSRALLAVVHHRLGEVDQAQKVLGEAEAAGTLEPVYWGLRAWLLAGKPDEAMQIVGKGLVACPGSQALKDLQAQLTNKKPLNMEGFGDTWYQFFPDQIPQSKRDEMARAAGMEVPTQNPTSAPQQAANRPPIPQKTWPHPRR